jgi:tetratricopeptide (TPR) repeat protein
MDPVAPAPRSVAAIIEAVFVLAATLGLLGWLVWRTLKKSEAPLRLVWKWGLTLGLVFAAARLCGPMLAKGDPISLVFGLLLSLPFALVVAILWAPNISSFVSSPLTALFDGGDEPAEARASYSIAEARIHQGRYADAVAAIRQELAKFPADVQGRLMLADVLANKLGQPLAAEETLRDLLALPTLSAPAIASALNLLADIRLQCDRDPAAARSALEEIAARLPNTPQSAHAAERIGHLPSVETMEARALGAAIELKPGLRDLGLQKVALPDPADQLDRRVTALLDQVQAFPADSESRAELVRLLAEEVGDLESARAQITYGLAVPHQHARQISRWLNLLATVEIRHGHNLEGARRALQRIIDQYPDSAVAETSRQRIAGLATELKGTEAKREVQLGTYERDLGLKKKKTA